MPRSANDSQALVRCANAGVAPFLTFVAGEQVSRARAHGTLQSRSRKVAIRMGKGDRVRPVQLDALAREALNAVRPVVMEGPVFCGQRGPYTDRGVRNLLVVHGRRGDVCHVHPHQFGHDTQRRLVEAVDLPTVAALLGHSRLETVRTYAQADVEAAERAAVAFEER